MSNKLLKKVLSLFLVISTLVVVLPAYGEKEIDVFVKGEKVKFDVNPCIINNRTYVEARGILQKLGYKMDWDSTTRTVKATKGKLEIQIPIDSTEILYITDYEDSLIWEQPAMIINGRTMIPLRAMGEIVLMKVEWNSVSREVRLIEHDHSSGNVTVGIKELTETELKLTEYYDSIGENGLSGGFDYRLNTMENDKRVLSLNKDTIYTIVNNSVESGLSVVDRALFIELMSGEDGGNNGGFKYSLFTVEVADGVVKSITQIYSP